MLKTILLGLTMIMSTLAQADEVIVDVKNQNMKINVNQPGRELSCTLSQSVDGVVRATLLVFLGTDAGTLQNAAIVQYSEGAEAQELCAKIEKIRNSTNMSFGFIHGRFDSQVILTEDKLIETLTITLRSSPSFVEPGLTTVVLTTTMEKNRVNPHNPT